MFSELSKLFPTTPRQAERTDTRQGIKRRPQDQRRRNTEDEDSASKEDDLWEDKATVSLNAMIGVLEEFLREQRRKAPSTPPQSEQGVAAKSDEETSNDPATKAPDQDRQQTPVMAKAAAAYGQQAQKSRSTSHSREDYDRFPSGILSGSNTRMIEEYLAKLKQLREKNMKELTIEKSASFLGSLGTAIDKAISSNKA